MSEPGQHEQAMREHRAARHAWQRTAAFLNAAARDQRNFASAMALVNLAWMALNALLTWLLLHHG